MAKIKFTDEQIILLEKNPVVKTVTPSQIDFTFEFKEHIILECKTFEQGLQYFEDNNVGTELLGHKRIEQSYYRWKKQFREQGNVPFILPNKGRPKQKISSTDAFKKLTPEQQVEVLLEEAKEQERDIYLLKKYMPSLDGSKVKKD